MRLMQTPSARRLLSNSTTWPLTPSVLRKTNSTASSRARTSPSPQPQATRSRASRLFPQMASMASSVSATLNRCVSLRVTCRPPTTAAHGVGTLPRTSGTTSALVTIKSMATPQFLPIAPSTSLKGVHLPIISAFITVRMTMFSVATSLIGVPLSALAGAH